ncbi:hypothetical protein HCCG_00118 [Helicobacter cinaedi CCUG 18818 = ATCC BAA-847]|uniref:Uncharacterized protein n=1 Tax=Helicobacter cinaedi CCUG 18818 = ATCC BAA-847 TaxID=537971 RepID=A0ABN0B7X4_9HELI|nr:hypothetical protein HCCG_00118 [Helicobacter cinaedi CCUG 18818 = ATCC BAA-847]
MDWCFAQVVILRDCFVQAVGTTLKVASLLSLAKLLKSLKDTSAAGFLKKMGFGKIFAAVA